MISWKTLGKLLESEPKFPTIKNVEEVEDETLYFDGLIRGTVVSGDPGSGKTTSVAGLAVDYMLKFPNRPLFVFDASGSLIDEIIKIYHCLPMDEFEQIDRRVVLDIPGDDTFVIPKPLFSREYGLSQEDQIAKAKNIFVELNHEIIERTPIMAGAITITLPYLSRLLWVMHDEHEGSWQITDAKNLLQDSYPGGDLSNAVYHYGKHAPAAADYFKQTLLREKLPPTTRIAKVDTLLGALQVLESDSLRARYGYPRPGITHQEIIDRGLIYLVSGELLNNKDDAQAFVYWDEFSSLRATINNRTPHDPDDVEVLAIFDEVYRLYDIKGMARELGQLPTYYRSRKLMPLVVIQAYWQLDPLLEQQIWNMGNQVTFTLSNFDDAYKFSQQAFEYDPKQEKLPAASRLGHPQLERSSDQYIMEANWIQRLPWRQVIMRRYLNERDREPFVAFVERTRERPMNNLPKPLPEIKESLFRRRAMPIKDALKVVNNRKLVHRRQDSSRPTA